MPYNGSGGFTRLMNWSNDALAGIKIKADRHDQEDDNFASGLTNAITKDGQTQPTADIPLNGKRITNLGAPAVDTDAATKAYADLPKPFTTGATISGADANGRLNFTSPTGANGITFTGADLSWLARLAGAPNADQPNRLVLNDSPTGAGTDVVGISDGGMMSFNSNAYILGNGYYKASAPAGWKTINAGWFTLMSSSASDGAYRFYASSASIAAHTVATLNQNFVINADGSAGARGNFTAGGVVQSANGAAILGVDGNVLGPVWTNWGPNDAYSAINARIEARAQAWANAVGNACVQQTRMAGEVTWNTITSGVAGKQQTAGYVLTGTAGGAGYITFYARQPQVYTPNGGWVAAFNF